MAIKDFDDILPHVGSFGPFQKRIFVLFLPVNYFLAVVYVSQIYQTLTPEHWCFVSELNELDADVRRNLSIPRENREGIDTFSRCLVYDVNWTLVDAGDATTWPNESTPTTKCSDGWEYDYSGGMYPTIVSEADWVCDDDWRSNFAQSMFFAGAIVGSLCFSYMADRLGRLPVLIVTNLLACAAGIATAFTYGFAGYVTCRFLVGLSYDFHYIMMYIILMEYVGPDKRTLVGNAPLALFLTLGTTTLPWIAYALADWRLFSIVTSAPLSLIVLAWWLVPESSRWLVHTGEIDRTIDILKDCARTNGKTVPAALYDEFREASQRSHLAEKAMNTSWFDLFRTPTIRWRMLRFIVVWMVIVVVYDGQVRSLEILSYNVFLSNTVAGLLELPGNLMPLLTMDTLGRRWTLFLVLGLSGLTGITAGFLSAGQSLAIAVLAMLGRFFATAAINAGTQYTVEVTPTQLRAQGVGIVGLAGHCATFFAPFILYLSTVNSTLPYLVLGALSTIGGLICLQLPETAMENLPESVTEAESFGSDQSFFHMPCRAKRHGRSPNAPAGGPGDSRQPDILGQDTTSSKAIQSVDSFDEGQINPSLCS